MSDTTSRSSALRWFQVRLPVIFLLGLLVAVFCGGYAAATRRAEETVKANREAEEKLARLGHLWVVVFRRHPGLIDTQERMAAREQDETTILQVAPGFYGGGLGSGFELKIRVSDLDQWHDAIEMLLKSRQLQYYDRWGLNRDGYGLVPVR